MKKKNENENEKKKKKKEKKTKENQCLGYSTFLYYLPPNRSIFLATGPRPIYLYIVELQNLLKCSCHIL